MHVYLEDDLSVSRRIGGHASLEHAPAAGLRNNSTSDDALAMGGLDDCLDVGRARGHLQPRCAQTTQEGHGSGMNNTNTLMHACDLQDGLARTGERVVCVAFHPDPLVDAVGRQDIAAAGHCAAYSLRHGEFVAGRRAAHAGLEVLVRRPPHQATVELAILDDAAVVEGLHRVAKALQCRGKANIHVHLIGHLNRTVKTIS